MRKLLILLGVPIDDLNMPEALDQIEEFVEIGRATGKSHQIATVNADFVVNSLRDPELRWILQEADMATADGMPLVWGARLLGVNLADRVTGADIVPALAERAAQKGYSLFLLGAKPGVAARAARILQDRYPGLHIAGVLSPPNRSVLDMDPALLNEIKAAKPDILLVAFGNPKQEKWIDMYARELQIPVSIGVGGTLDFIAGITKRAPHWMQRAGVEWLYRLMQEPRRLWKRYILDLFYFSYFFIRQWWEMRKGRPPSPLLPTSGTVIVEDTAILAIRGRLDVTNQALFVRQASLALATTPFLIVNLARTEFLDSSALGVLVALSKRAADAGGALWFAAVPPHIAQLLQITRLDYFFESYEDVEAALTARYVRPQPFTEPEENVGDWVVVKMPRTVDAETTPTMIDTCLGNLKRHPQLILDFSETVFLSSAGLAAIIQLDRQARREQRELRVAGCTRDVLRTIQLIRLDLIVPIFHDVQAAVTADSSGGTYASHIISD